MTTHQKQDLTTISMMEALDILSYLAETNSGVSTEKVSSVVEEVNADHWNIQKFSQLSPPDKIKLLKEIFIVIHKTLRKYYDKEYIHVNPTETVEQIKNIMVLAGEAAKKLDKFHEVVETGNIQDWREYKKLQEFYLKKIAKKIDTATLGEWLLGLTKHAWLQFEDSTKASKIETQHIFVDLDSVKKDTEYELFFLRKQDATRFYNPRLLRNMMLVSDFGDKLHGQKPISDPLAEIEHWRDQAYLFASKSFLKKLRPTMESYVREVMNLKDKEIVAEVNKCIMALLFCIDATHPLVESFEKSTKAYFADFQFYLHAALRHPEYLKLLTFDHSELSRYQRILKDTLQSMCTIIYENFKFYEPISEHVQELIAHGNELISAEHEEAVKSSGFLWNSIACDNKALSKLFKNSPLRHIGKILKDIQDGEVSGFDPFHQQAMPTRWYEVSFGDKTLANLHIPSPISQEFIHKVSVIDEFKTFLRACISTMPNKNLIMINLQDRTSWKEHYRCKAIEELATHEEFVDCLHAATLAKDTDFYYQVEPYSRINHAEVFIKQLYDQVEDIDNGFFFKEDIFVKLFPQFVESLIQGIHKVFFSEKNILLREHRLDFIEIFYLFLQLKLIDMYNADFFSLTCKDGADCSASSNAEFFVFLKILKGENFTSHDRKLINKMLYTPAIVLRERLIQPERFNRFLSTLKCLELAREHMGPAEFSKAIKETFGPMFTMPITELIINYP